MPVFVRRSPFPEGDSPSPPAQEQKIDGLRVPQARVLAALVPDDPKLSRINWPLLTRASLAVRAGYTAVSGSVTRALNGIREGSSSGDAHPGLLARGLVEEVALDIDGAEEVSYRATAAGAAAYRAHIAAHGALPPQRDKAASVNTRRGYRNPHLEEKTAENALDTADDRP